jgi:hypothetical protein
MSNGRISLSGNADALDRETKLEQERWFEFQAKQVFLEHDNFFYLRAACLDGYHTFVGNSQICVCGRDQRGPALKDPAFFSWPEGAE